MLFKYSHNYSVYETYILHMPISIFIIFFMMLHRPHVIILNDCIVIVHIYLTASLKWIIWGHLYSDILFESPQAVGNLTGIHKEMSSKQMKLLKNVFFSLSKLYQAIFLIRSFKFIIGHQEDIGTVTRSWN